MRNKRLYFLIISLSFYTSVFCENQNLAKLILNGCPDNYIGQYADNSKDKSGTGIIRTSGNGIYIGDLNRNKYNGRGMMVAGDKGEISNAPFTYAYVGGWIKGKKEGIGVCYASNGDIIYSGRFENDKPIDTYPTPNPDMNRYFSMMETDNGYYIGEVVKGEPEGYGLCIQEDGAYWIGTHRNGQRSGLSIFLYGPYEWKTVKYKDGFPKDISSSIEYDNRNAIIKARNKQIWSEFWTGMSEVAEGLVDVGTQYVQSKTGMDYNTYTSSADNTTMDSTQPQSSNKSTKTKTDNSKKKNDCGTAWMSDSRVYSNYESQLIKGGQSIDDIRSIKQKMRSIRTKWESRGCPITKSSWED